MLSSLEMIAGYFIYLAHTGVAQHVVKQKEDLFVIRREVVKGKDGLVSEVFLSA